MRLLLLRQEPCLHRLWTCFKMEFCLFQIRPKFFTNFQKVWQIWHEFSNDFYRIPIEFQKKNWQDFDKISTIICSKHHNNHHCKGNLDIFTNHDIELCFWNSTFVYHWSKEITLSHPRNWRDYIRHLDPSSHAQLIKYSLKRPRVQEEGGGGNNLLWTYLYEEICHWFNEVIMAGDTTVTSCSLKRPRRLRSLQPPPAALHHRDAPSLRCLRLLQSSACRCLPAHCVVVACSRRTSSARNKRRRLRSLQAAAAAACSPPVGLGMGNSWDGPDG